MVMVMRQAMPWPSLCPANSVMMTQQCLHGSTSGLTGTQTPVSVACPMTSLGSI